MKSLPRFFVLIACSVAFAATCTAQSLFVASFADPYENDPGINGVLAFDPVSGAYQKTYAGVFDPTDFAFAPNGDLVGSSFQGEVVRGVREAGFATLFDGTGAGKGDLVPDVPFRAPWGVAFSPTGDLFVADSSKARIARFQTGTYNSKGAITGNRLATPLGIRFGPAGNLYVANYGTSEILLFDGETGAFKSVFVSSSNVKNPVGLVFGSDGDLYVAGAGNAFGFGGQVAQPVLRFDGKTGAPKGAFTSGKDFPGFQPAFGPDGDLWVTTGDNRLIHRFDGKTGVYKSTLSNAAVLGQTIGLAFTPAAKVLNVSTRLQVGSGDQALICGFIVTGPFPKRVIVRAVGPSLTQAGVTGALQDPTLELHDASGAIIAANDNWKDSQQTEIAATGVAPKNDGESAIVRILAPGNYTAVVAGKNGGTGVGVVEAYDLNQAEESKLANISTRGLVQQADNIMIAGFIVRPAGGGETKTVVRGIGPSLAAAGVSGALQDPFVELRNANGALVASNDSWEETQKGQIEGYGLQPTDRREAAIASTLAAGAYTAVLRGSNGTTGIGLVEVYNVN